MVTVMDTDVIVAAMCSPTGASAELVRRALRGQISIAASVSLFMEYEAACSRPENLAAAMLTPRECDMYINGLASLVRPVDVHFLWRPQLRDPADELVLEAAVNASADVLLAFNHPHFSGAVRRFNLNLMRPGDFLRSLSCET